MQQEVVLPPTLFNMDMGRLPPYLNSIPIMSFAFYADGVTIWFTMGSVGEQEHTPQSVFDAVQSFLEKVVTTNTQDMTEYVEVLFGPQQQADEMRTLKDLILKNTSIRRQLTGRVIALFIIHESKVETWLNKMKKTGTKILHFI